MTHRPAELPEFQTDAWSAADGDDSIEFAEFTGDAAGSDDSASTPVADAARLEGGDEAAESPPPAWFRSRPDAPSENSDAGLNAENPNGDASRTAANSAAVEAGAIVADETSISDRARARKRKRRKRDGQRSGSGNADARLIEPAKEAPKLTWQKDGKKLALLWLVSHASCGYGISAIIHTLLLTGGSLIVFHALDQNQAISTTITEADSMPVEFTEIMDLTIEPPGGSDIQLPQFKTIPITTTETNINSSILNSAASAAGNDGNEGSPGENIGFTIAMPEGGKVVSKGSFSAWTVPEDPEPFRRYTIVIRIRLPEKTKVYRITDLSGKVEGSDTYVQHLPFDPVHKELIPRSERGGQFFNLRSSSRLRVIKNHVQIMIPVKGGKSLISDTIHVRSRMLKEDQKLKIEF